MTIKDFCKFCLNNKKSSAMLIALGFSFVMILFAMSATKIIIRTLKEVTHFEESREAYYAARSGLTEALQIAKDTEAGFEVDVPHAGPTIPSDITDTPYEYKRINFANGSYANFHTIARADHIYDMVGGVKTEIDSYYYIPLQGWGRAGIDCDTVRPWDKDDSDGADDSCNWEKLRPGEMVEIPLYRQAADWSIENPELGGIGLGELKVKMRTACKTPDPGGNCLARYDIDFFEFQEEVIVNWEITGDCDDDTTDGLDNAYQCTLIGFTHELDDGSIGTNDSWIRGEEISHGTTSDIPVLIQDRPGHDVDNPKLENDPGWSPPDSYISNFLKNQGAWIFTDHRKINKPKLKLHFITEISEFDETKIPYLEYQIVTDQPIATPHKYVISEGFSGDFKQSLQIRQRLDTIVLNFVIQN